MASGKVNFEKLNSNNYFNWKYRMELFLKRQKLWSTLNEEKPVLLANNTNEEIVNKWIEKDETAHSWICSWVDDNQLCHVRNTKTGKEAWAALKGYHEKDTISNKVSLIRQICNMKLEEMGNMEQHISLMTDQFQKLTDIGDKISDSWSVGMLLSSLPSSYDTLIVALETRPEADLTLSLVQQKLIAEFNRRNEQQNNQENESALKFTNEAICYSWKEGGHIKRNCPKLKLWSNKENNDTHEVKMTQEKDSDSYSDSDYLFTISPKGFNGWIIDSGATRHVTSDKNLFITYESTTDKYIKVANGKKVRVEGKGTCKIEYFNADGKIKSAKVTDVLYMPDIDGSMLSVKKLINKGYEVNFIDDKCEIKRNNVVIAVADSVSNLYKLRQSNNVPDAMRSKVSVEVAKLISCDTNRCMKQSQQLQKKVMASKVYGIVKWFNVKNGYGFINRNDTKEDIFVHRTGIDANNQRQVINSIGNGDIVMFDIVIGRKGNEAVNVIRQKSKPMNKPTDNSEGETDKWKYVFDIKKRFQNDNNLKIHCNHDSHEGKRFDQRNDGLKQLTYKHALMQGSKNCSKLIEEEKISNQTLKSIKDNPSNRFVILCE